MVDFYLDGIILLHFYFAEMIFNIITADTLFAHYVSRIVCYSASDSGVSGRLRRENDVFNHHAQRFIRELMVRAEAHIKAVSATLMASESEESRVVTFPSVQVQMLVMRIHTPVVASAEMSYGCQSRYYI